MRENTVSWCVRKSPEAVSPFCRRSVVEISVAGQRDTESWFTNVCVCVFPSTSHTSSSRASKGILDDQLGTLRSKARVLRQTAQLFIAIFHVQLKDAENIHLVG